MNRELLQRVSAHDGVTQQIVDRTVQIGGRYLEVKRGRGRKVRRGTTLYSSFLELDNNNNRLFRRYNLLFVTTLIKHYFIISPNDS